MYILIFYLYVWTFNELTLNDPRKIGQNTKIKKTNKFFISISKLRILLGYLWNKNGIKSRFRKKKKCHMLQLPQEKLYNRHLVLCDTQLPTIVYFFCPKISCKGKQKLMKTFKWLLLCRLWFKTKLFKRRKKTSCTNYSITRFYRVGAFLDINSLSISYLRFKTNWIEKWF